MSEHTPTPWMNCEHFTDGKHDMHIIVCEANNNGVARLLHNQFGDYEAETNANAEFIVRACNAHDDLLAACESLLAITEPDEWAAYEPDEQAAFRAARAAIDKARKDGPA